MRRFLMLVTSMAALGFASGQALAQPGFGAGPVPAQEQLSALDQQIANDNTAVAADRSQMDRDQSNPEMLAEDEHQLHEDALVQQYHRGTYGQYRRFEDKGKW